MDIRKWSDLYSRDCELKYNSNNTIKTYTNCVNKFLYEFRNEVEPKSISNNKIKDWLMSYSTLNTRKQMLCSVKSFYLITVGMNKKLNKIPYPKKEKKLPRVIDSDYLKETILNVSNLKHKSILMLGYSCALRVSEVVNLKIKDIDSKRGVINIRNGKGRKDRIVVLSETLLNTLRDYYKEYTPCEYLFNSQKGINKTYSPTSCNKIVKKYLGNEYHYHLLRHSGATTMFENGTDINVIQKLLGHNSIKTTMIYTHISRQHLLKVKTPM